MPGIFDIIGPVTVGPSSSHTAGAIRIGQAVQKLLGGQVYRAVITFYGSFAQTYHGHGTDKAMIGGLLGLAMDDTMIRTSLSEAQRRGLAYHIHTGEDDRYHPNTVVVEAQGEGGQARIRASSVGGGNISLDELDGYELGVGCALPTLILPHTDHAGVVAAVAAALSAQGYNIASMKVSRARRGGNAMMVIETDAELPADMLAQLQALRGVHKAIYIPQL